MIPGRDLASSDAVRAYLVEQLNLALRRPGMFGGKIAIRMLFDHLLFVEQRPQVWNEEQHALQQRGAFASTGVQGVLDALLPRDHGHGMSSVYAEIARRQGRLVADRVLDGAAYASLRESAGEWAARDRVWSDVLARFGPPSILFGGTNPLYGKTLGYLSEDAGQPMVFFHLWNGTDDDAEQPWPPTDPEPLLLAVRHGDGPFRDTFTFTPEGRRRKPAPPPSPLSE
ncbi:hypothetical protein ACFRCG_02945 [Embleya sp. NPDC056575]|uniref:hypothetical protein n=1 Tax=unclassified Embleya TaxID=2699296 RepID=UPI0036993CBD